MLLFFHALKDDAMNFETYQKTAFRRFQRQGNKYPLTKNRHESKGMIAKEDSKAEEICIV